MRRLLGRIDATLAATLKTSLKLKPATDEEIAAAEKKFQLQFPPGRGTRASPLQSERLRTLLCVRCVRVLCDQS